MICTTVNEDLSLEIFSKAKYIVLLDEKNMEIIYKEENPALNSPMKRPLVARECVKLKANKVIAPHGSLCYPSYRILKKSNVEILVSNRGVQLNEAKINKVNMKEVAYSSFLAIYERIEEALKHK